MLIGPVFTREAITTPRRLQHYFYRVVYGLALLILMCTAWLALAGTQVIRNLGDMARFGELLFQKLALFQLVLMLFMASLSAASAVSQEKDRRTLILLLMSRLNNCELVLGKLLASMLQVVTMLVASLPVFWMMTLFGGVAEGQVWGVFAVTCAAALTAGSLGSVLALWREKTFQTLAMTVLGLALWLMIGEVFHAGMLGDQFAGWTAEEWSVAFSPFRALTAAAGASTSASPWWGAAPVSFLATSLGLTILLNAWAIVMVRIWNPSRLLRPGASGLREAEQSGSAAEAASDQAAGPATGQATSSKSGRVGGRRVWDNPVLWREACTWAYGRKVLLIKLCYLVVFAAVALVLRRAGASAAAAEAASSAWTALAPAGTEFLALFFLALFFLISLVMVNALAVTSITNERDGQALDLLLVTDLTPREFVLGKLLGVLWVTREMVALPLALCVYLRLLGGVTTENMVLLMLGLINMDVFVAMLGIHCGMTYANSRSAIGVSLGVVFFLFLGIVTCIVIMVSFSGSFQTQLAPFVAFIVGGGIGLLISLGYRNPSRAILIASFGLPFATFYAITSFVLGNRELWVFLVSAAAYGFTTAAMMVPAIGEFDIAMGRTKTAEED